MSLKPPLHPGNAMILRMFTFCCEPLAHRFLAPNLPLNSYGEFLLRDPTGTSLAYLGALDDRVFAEVRSLLDAHLPEHIGKRQKAVLLHECYGEVACDLDTRGRSFAIGQFAKCPICLSPKMKSWNEAEPAEFVEVDVPPVTYSFWNSLDFQARSTRVARWLDENASKHLGYSL